MANEVRLSGQELTDVRDAIDLKLASLKRAQKSASPAFKAVYDAEVSRYNALLGKLG